LERNDNNPLKLNENLCTEALRTFEISKIHTIMTTKTIRILVMITLLVHGIGHFQGVVSSLGVKFNASTSNVSWLLKGLGQKANTVICLILFLGAALSGILAGLAFMGILLPESSWQALALVAAFFSTACLILFPAALAMFFNKAGAIAVNLIIYYSILFNGRWPSAVFDN
jgi:hypothetical protein